MRVLIAGIIGGILMFIWNSLAHTVLPLGMMGFQTATEQDTAIAAVQASATSGDLHAAGHLARAMAGRGSDEGLR